MPAKWIEDIVTKCLPLSSMKVGKIIMHPKGYKVKIISGQYWGTRGLSNFWTWKRVHKNGKLGKSVSGYGW